MRKLGAVLAAALFAASFAIVRPAWAGELLLGVIVVTDGGSGTNFTAGAAANADGVMPASPTFISGTTCVVGFDVGANRKLTVQTDEGCFICINAPGADAGNCLSTAANEKFPTSTGSAKSFPASSWNWDGGSQSTPCTTTRWGNWVAVSPPLGGSACHARVFSRAGTE